jgi:ATP-dependent helicase/nuclease subunit B
MSVQFILGKPGTGKTTRVLQEIREKISAGENAPLYYLVPEQFSLQSERLLLDGGREAATQVQVLSFNRLAYRLFSVLGSPQGKHADDLGKQMLLRKVLLEVSGELEFYKSATDKQGFVQELAATITELNHHCVSASDLTERAALSSPALAAKLRDTAKILAKYREAVAGRYLLTDEMPQLLCKKLEQATESLPLLDGAFFWVDGFSGFTPQERQVLLHIIKRAAMVTFTITIGVGEPLTKLEKLTHGAELLYLKENFRHANAVGLASFVEQKIFNSPQSNIEIISAADKYAAVYATAQKVLSFINEGWRFRDIAIICNRPQYEKILQNVFDRLKIPMFVDTEIDILSHPLTEMIRAALDIPSKNWNYESVFRFLKTRLTKIPNVDILENYALANGINSYRWNYSFSDEQAESARRLLLDALAPFKKMRADSTDTVRNHARRVYDMLYALRVPETLQEWFDDFMLSDPETARLHGQIWSKLCEVFDKLVEILGDEKISLKNFAATLDAGLCQVGLGRIPPTVDQVMLGDISRSRYPRIKAMLVLGANDGVFPPAPPQSGLFTDYERKILKNSALELAPENSAKISDLNYNLYCTLSQPTEKLIFIYAEAETNGKPLRPSPIIAKIKRFFPALKTVSAKTPTEPSANESIFFEPETLSSAAVSQLYGQTIYTAATRLEAFSRCPFAYYMNYILGAKPRKHYEVLPADLGALFHEVIAGFTKRVQGRGVPITRAEIAAVVNDLVDALHLEDSIFHSSARNKHILNKVRRVATASCWALSEQIKRENFSPAMVEHEIFESISLDNGKTLALNGRVDRVDIFSQNSEEFIKIIDYKSGNTKFSRDDALKGLQLQLVLYMNAFLKSRKSATPAGVFYFPIDDPIIDADDFLSDVAREEGLLKCFKMSGLEAGEDFLQFAHEVECKAKELGNRMSQGEIIAQAYTKGQKSPCNFCKYSAVCGKK